MGESHHLPPDGKPLSTPFNSACTCCNRTRATARVRKGWPKGQKAVYLICAHCDRDPSDLIYSPLADKVPEDS